MSLDIIVTTDKPKSEEVPITASPSNKSIGYDATSSSSAPSVPPPPIEVFRCLRHNNDVYHDIFISYRVATEKKVADKLSLLLDASRKHDGSKIRTFLDANCLVDGGNWEKNFLSALHHSKLIVLILSEAGLDLPSASDSTKTKIQTADQEQDNCLLEYEYAMKLREEFKAKIFLLLVPKEAVLGGTKCTVKFPTSDAGIARRLAMYSSTQHHRHRDNTRGPLVSETMAKLLGVIKAPGMNYAHLDPDDLSARLPEILWTLHELEKRHPFWDRVSMYLEDVGSLYVRTLLIGVAAGLVFPILSLCCIFDAKSTRHRALRVGIVIGHATWMLAISIFFFYDAYRIEKCDPTDPYCETNESNAFLFLAIICLMLGIGGFGIVGFLATRGKSKSAKYSRLG